MWKVKSVKYIFITIFLWNSTNAIAQTSFDSIYHQANDLYLAEKFPEALEQYKLLIDAGKSSENIYYNIANCYYKNNEYGNSILYYEKVLKLNPDNVNTIHNLQLVNTKIEENIKFLPDLVFVSWWKKIVYFFSANTWAWISIIFSWLSLLFMAVYLFVKNQWLHKVGFINSLIFGILSMLSLMITALVTDNLFKKNEVVLISKSSFAKDAPSDKAANQKLYYEGTKLRSIDEVDGYFKTKSPEGEILWLDKKDFREI